MGVSSDGILFYGVPVNVGEDAELSAREVFVDSEGNHIGWEEWLNGKLGEGHGLNMVLYCSYDYTMYGLCVADSYAYVARGDSTNVTELVNIPTIPWRKRIQDAMTALGLEPYPERDYRTQETTPKEIGWHIVSMMG